MQKKQAELPSLASTWEPSFENGKLLRASEHAKRLSFPSGKALEPS
jgi:hypothetical protein